MKADMWIVVLNFLAHWTLTDAQVRNICTWISNFSLLQITVGALKIPTKESGASARCCKQTNMKSPHSCTILPNVAATNWCHFWSFVANPWGRDPDVCGISTVH